MGAPLRTEREPVVVIGAGIGGLCAAAVLAIRGVPVRVVERNPEAGGKIHRLEVAGRRVDAGPTVLTLREVFDAVFAQAGRSLDAVVGLRPLERLARHAWDGGDHLDLYADRRRSMEAIGDFAGAAAAADFERFCHRVRRIYEIMDGPFLRTERPSVTSLTLALTPGRLHHLIAARPFASLWTALEGHFRDSRLRQLFARYATYTGSSPFAAPATLRLIAHVENAGVWSIDGGLHRLATAVEQLAEDHGAVFDYGAAVTEVEISHGRASGVRLADGRRLSAAAVIANADAAQIAAGALGAGLRPAVPSARPEASLSAVTWAMVARPQGRPLIRHNVFFSRDYGAEFRALFDRRRLPSEPTVYVCAQDRLDADTPEPEGAEALLCLINAPADGAAAVPDAEALAEACAATQRTLARCGLRIDEEATFRASTPADFERRFAAPGGALYGCATHGWRAAFRRPGAATQFPGLYLAGGSVHPGPGVPMAALSGRLAAERLLADREAAAGRRLGPRPRVRLP